MRTKLSKVAASFRDPSGFVLSRNGVIFRQVNKVYKANYELLMKSGLYDELITHKHLIPHTSTSEKGDSEASFKVIKPEKIPFISYPYEWCFGMLKAAALQTLTIQKIALKHSMSLKDASAFNIQFREGKPILIDTLSFEKYEPGRPWVAYKQFVEHFLAPLALMAIVDIRLTRLTAQFLDGIPTDLASRLLPFYTRLNPSLLLHIHAHAASQKKFSEAKLSDSQLTASVSKQALLGIIDSLEGTIDNLQWSPKGTQWSDYYQKGKNNYSDESLGQKIDVVKKWAKRVKPKTVWDLGANSGTFSRVAVESGAEVIAFDNDYGALEENYHTVIKNHETSVLPLFCDITNPSPALGWANQERPSLLERGPVDLILSLALVHHLAIAQNIPLSNIALLFSKLSTFLIIEFIPKTDSQVKILLMNREDIFPEYTQIGFETAFKQQFQIVSATPIKKSHRILYLMKRKA